MSKDLYHNMDFAHAKAEIERLKAEVEAYKSASDEVAAAFLALPNPHNQVARVVDGIESLKAEVERLKCFIIDQMSEISAPCDEAEQEIGRQVEQRQHWEQIAKEGK